ncbi:hypothetical protein ACUN24_20140 [Pedobacter sp. WC2501]|uniref:hypothetical protein n=1 Tax=Pedobacter sp. WC2501 TaxID=3461400 RepID=UPI004045D774
MKNAKILLLLIFAVFLFANSCKKDHDNLLEDLPSNSSLITEAKKYYSTTVKKDFASTAQLKKFEGSQPMWDNSARAIQNNGTNIILTDYPAYNMKSRAFAFARSYVFVENKTKVKDGFIVEVFGDKSFLDENAKKIFISYNSENIAGFTGRIMIYDLDYKLIDGRIFKDGVKTTGRSSISARRKANGKASTESLVTTMSEGQCIDWYMVSTWYDDSGQPIKSDEVLLYTTCSNGGSGTEPGGGGLGVITDCAGVENGAAQMASCGCIRGTTGIPSCPKDPCVERNNVSSRAQSSAVSSQKSTIISNSTNVEWGAEQNINAWPGGTSYNQVDARTNAATNNFSPNFTWNATNGYTLGAAHGHPGGTGPSPADVFWATENVGSSALRAAGPDATAYYETNVTVTTYTPNGTTYVVQINDWPGMIAENLNNFKGNEANFNYNYQQEAQNYLIANNSTDVGAAGVWALMSLFGDKITIYKAEPGSNDLSPVEKIGFTVQDKICLH